MAEEILSGDLQLPDDITIPPPPHVYGSSSAGEPRLIITHIVNHNFKSYSGRQVLGPFHKSFTAIVGPNGSGKSNVIDSMLFVFGYRANKIRSKKLSVLIHHSENAAKATSCTVEVHFEKITDLDDGGYCTVPDSSFSISRRVTHENTSQYYIDNKKVLFKEVANLLQGSGIDLNHNRFLILQGEVEQIALMKPKSQNEHGDGMLEFLEDIIGSSRYKEAIESLCKKVDFFDEERKDKLTRVKVVEKDKDQLEPLHNKAVEYLQKKNERTKLDSQLKQYYIHTFAQEGESVKEKIEAMKLLLTDEENDVKETKEGRKLKAKEMNKIAMTLEKCHEYHTQQKDKMRELEKTNVKVFEDRKYRKGKVKELTKKLDQDKKKLDGLLKNVEKLEQDINDSMQDRDDMLKNRKDMEGKLNDALQCLKPETQQLQDKKEAVEKVLLEEMKDVNDAKQKLDVAKVELQLLNTKLQNASNTLQQCKKQIEDAKSQEQTAKENLSDFIQLTPKLEKEVAELTKQLDQLKKDKKCIELQLEECRSSLAEAKLSSQVNRSNQSVLKFLMQLKTSGKVSGIFGRLGDLGVIDDRYDVAISSCCPALENILVDNIDTAQKCVQELKKNEIGQATFIALNKMDKYQQAIKSNTNTELPRLVDLVDPKEEKYRLAFYHALRDTLVAENLTSASKVAYSKSRRWRVVTLQGEVIDTSGTMSGGGNKVVKGRMGKTYVNQDMSPEDITHLQLKSDDNEAKLTEIHSNILQLEEILSQKNKKLLENKSSIKLLQQEVSSQHSLLARLNSRLSELEQAVVDAEPDPKVKKSLQQNVNKLQTTFEKASEKTNVLEQKKNSFDEEISKINESRLRPFRSSIEKQKQLLDDIGKTITKQKASFSTAKRNIAKCEKNISFMSSELEQNTEEIVALETQWAELETEGSTVLNDINHAEQEEAKYNQELQNKQTELKTLENLEYSALERYKKIQQDFHCLSTELNDKSEKMKQWNDQLSKLKLHEIEHEENTTLKTYSAEEIEIMKEEEIKAQITVLDRETENLHPNMNAIAEYKEKQQIYLQRVSELDEVTTKRDNYRKLHDHLRKCRLNEFSEGFLIITNKLKEIYQMITLGGDAELEFVDSLDPFSEGIIFSVRPPKKSWKNICNLSGGEKTLSSLALVFALHHFRPTPLYVMDEIDAALDFKNVTIIAHYIVERTKNAQFIIISLRNNMFEVADRLVGIYKTDNCTKTATIEPGLMISAAQ